MYSFRTKGDKVALICTGTLTNAALLLKVHPSIVDKVEIVFMGGSIGPMCMAGMYTRGTRPLDLQLDHSKKGKTKSSIHDMLICTGAMACLGNSGPTAEFNIQMDPEAAKIVMDSLVQKTMIPLQITHNAIITNEIEQRLIGNLDPDKPESQYRTCIKGFLNFFRETYADVFSFDGPPLHDPVAVAYVLKPDIFVRKEYYIDIETKSEV